MDNKWEIIAKDCEEESVDSNGQYVTTFDKEKFAKLIAKECMALCIETSNDYFKLRKAAFEFGEKTIYAEGEAASDIIKHKIQKHFGVKNDS